MDLLLVLLSATALLALGLVADRVDRDLRGGYRVAGRADRTDGGDRPLHLALLALSPEEFARYGPAHVEEAVRAAVELGQHCPPAASRDALGRKRRGTAPRIDVVPV